MYHVSHTHFYVTDTIQNQVILSSFHSIITGQWQSVAHATYATMVKHTASAFLLVKAAYFSLETYEKEQ